jgi:hypothetical protein
MFTECKNQDGKVKLRQDFFAQFQNLAGALSYMSKSCFLFPPLGETMTTSPWGCQNKVSHFYRQVEQ